MLSKVVEVVKLIDSFRSGVLLHGHRAPTVNKVNITERGKLIERPL